MATLPHFYLTWTDILSDVYEGILILHLHDITSATTEKKEKTKKRKKSNEKRKRKMSNEIKNKEN